MSLLRQFIKTGPKKHEKNP